MIFNHSTAAISLEIHHRLYSHKSFLGLFTSQKDLHQWDYFADSLYFLQLIKRIFWKGKRKHKKVAVYGVGSSAY
jgi:hypothetical protein